MIARLFGARLSNVLQWSRTSTSSAFNIHTQSLNSAGKLLPTWSPVQSTLFCLRPPVILHSNYNNTFRQTIRGFVSQQNNSEAKRVKSFATYVLACFIFMLGGAYAGVPLYRMICQSTGYGGEVKKGHDTSKLETMKPVNNRVIRVRFNADTASSMQWNFKPQQTEIKLVPGETALAFYRAKNPTDVPIVGISTYNVIPFEAGQYFNKIQCFCFEEQRLNPHEEVDMPVFFFIDPEYCDDPKMEKIDVITLSYTFFEAKEGVNLTVPNYYRPHQQ